MIATNTIQCIFKKRTLGNINMCIKVQQLLSASAQTGAGHTPRDTRGTVLIACADRHMFDR